MDTYDFETEHRAGKRHGNADAMSRGPGKQCGDEKCLVRVVTRSRVWKPPGGSRMEQSTNEEEPKSSPEQQEKPKRRRGRPKKKEMRSEEDEGREEDSKSGEREKRTLTKKSRKTQGEGEELLHAEAVKWLLCVDLNLEMWKKAQDKDTVLGKFAQLKEKGVKPSYDEISDQGNEYKSYWAQWESVELSQDGLLFRKLQGPGSFRRVQLIVPRKLIEVVLGMMHDSVTAGHMGVRRTLACTHLRFTGISRESQ